MRTPSDIRTAADAVRALRAARSRRDVAAVQAAFAAHGSPDDVALVGEVAALALDGLRAAAEARRDPLTAVLNRRGFNERCAELVADGLRPVTVGVFDVVGLKAINDRHGHPAGSGVLRAAAEALRATFGTDAIIGRLGGDEFSVVLPGEHDHGVLRGRLDATVRGRAAMPDVPRLELSAGFAGGLAGSGAEVREHVVAADADLYARRRANAATPRLHDRIRAHRAHPSAVSR